MLLEEPLVHRLDDDVEAQIHSVQLHPCMRDASGGHTGVTEQTRRQPLGQIRRILHGVVEHQLGQPGVFLILGELIELHREAGLLIHGAETAHALEMKPHVGQHATSVPHRPSHVIARRATERCQLIGWNLKLKTPHRGVVEERLAGLPLAELRA